MKRTDHSFDHNSSRYAEPHKVDRRTSRRRSEVRHGKIYEPDSSNTIRAVTPDSATSTSFDITALPSPTSYTSQTLSQIPSREPSISVSNTDEETVIDSRKRKSKKKKSRNSDHIPSDASPNAFFEKARKRLGSITTAATGSSRQDESIGSIGFPSVIQASVFPDIQEHNNPRLPFTPRRTISSDTANSLGLGLPIMRSPPPLDSDSNRILSLMKTTCGRMHGILFYRPIGTSAWHSGYCAINVAPGSLVCQTKGDVTTTEVLVPDLRGCSVRTHYDPQSQGTYISVVLPVAGFGYQLRPPVPETFDSWLAALLCWQPLRPKGIHNKMAKPQPVSMSDNKKAVGQRRMSDMANARGTAIVKAGQMLMWDGMLPSGSHRHHAKRSKSETTDEHQLWKRVNCTLHENGIFRLLDQNTNSNLRTIRLSHVARCAVQRLDQSILDSPNCIIIYPQYALHPSGSRNENPIVLRFNSKIAFEAWYVLLRALTVPELYGPEAPSNVSLQDPGYTNSSAFKDMVRIERTLTVKITEAKFPHLAPADLPPRPQSGKVSKGHVEDKSGSDVYADVLIGRDLRARTAAKPHARSAFWAEEFILEDLPSALSRVTVAVKLGNADEKEWTMVAGESYELPVGDTIPGFQAIEVSAHDTVFGRVDISINELEQEKSVEKWWPLSDNNGHQIGQILMKLHLVENVVLMESEYAGLNGLLTKFENSLTTQIAHVLGPELKQLSDVLLDIFQAKDQAEEWINNLVEEEIDGIYRDTPPVRMRFSGRIHSNDSYESAEQREMLVRDLSRSATMEANLLFRGNSLVTKALDAHMRRVGREYLENILGEKLRNIVATNPNCEVDPMRVKSTEQLDRNWVNLLNVTNTIWKAIAQSSAVCPPGMRNILKHIQSCAEDRYGSFIRTVKYTSVSGFLFLRFFCPAILNPKLFGLIDDHPPERPRRTFTLVAKSLIVLANMAKFGAKEPWMENMNKFLSTATPEFRIFVEEICSYVDAPSAFPDPQYQASMQIRNRLPALSREGLPSLPFLLDLPKLDSMLVDIWIDNAPSDILTGDAEEPVKKFHQVCLDLKSRTRECVSHAERAEEPDGTLEHQWQQMLSDQHRKKNIMLNPYEEVINDEEITALPQARDSGRKSSMYNSEAADYARDSDSTPTNSSSIAPGFENRRIVFTNPRYNDKAMSSTNSSTISFDPHDESHRPRHPGTSRENSSKGKFFDLASRRRNKGEHSDHGHSDYEGGKF